MSEGPTTRPTSGSGPLQGVRVLDLTSVVFGPYATQILADLGADVIKVEGPAQNEKGEGGDTMRYAGSTPVKGFGPIFMNLNRNKRSVYLDLSQPKDAEGMRELIASADVFVSNVRMASLRRLGMDYDSVAAIRPDIDDPDELAAGSPADVMGEKRWPEPVEQPWRRTPGGVHDRDLLGLRTERDPEPPAVRANGQVAG